MAGRGYAGMMGKADLQINDPSFAQVGGVIRAKSKTFHFATALLPHVQRRAVRALYAFCRYTDDLVDEHKVTPEALEEWRLQARQPPQQQSHAVLRAWSIARQVFGVDIRYQEELIDGVVMDLVNRRYQTWEDLQGYCYRVASTVGLLSMPIIGLCEGVSFEQAKPYAVQLGIALQLTNILRDVGEDAQFGRVYLPEDDLTQFGLTRADVLEGVFDQRFIALMRFEIARARALYAQALPGVAMLSPKARPAVGVAALLYRAILDEIETIHYEVFSLRAHTTLWKKITLLPRCLHEVSRLQASAGS